MNYIDFYKNSQNYITFRNRWEVNFILNALNTCTDDEIKELIINGMNKHISITTLVSIFNVLISCERAFNFYEILKLLPSNKKNYEVLDRFHYHIKYDTMHNGFYTYYYDSFKSGTIPPKVRKDYEKYLSDEDYKQLLIKFAKYVIS